MLKPEAVWSTHLNNKNKIVNLFDKSITKSWKPPSNHKGHSFTLKLATCKMSLAGVSIRNNNQWRATENFTILGILEDGGPWEQLLKGRFDNPLLAGAPAPILKTFFFKEAVDLQFLRFDLDSFWGRIGGGLNYLEVLPVSGNFSVLVSYNFLFNAELCESKEHDICLPYYCGSPTLKIIKPSNVHCVGQEENLCDHNCTGDSSLTNCKY